MSLAGFPAARLWFEDTCSLFPYYKCLHYQNTFKKLLKLTRFWYLTSRGSFIKNIFKNLLILFIALQPLQSYTTINITNPDDNGFQYLHAELCGSKYSSSLSHTQKIYNLLDRINTLIISDMSVDCICCESLETSSLDSIDLAIKQHLLIQEHTITHTSFYNHNVKIFPFNTQVRAPPYV